MENICNLKKRMIYRALAHSCIACVINLECFVGWLAVIGVNHFTQR